MKITRNQTIIMGILNITPDSFSDGGVYYNNPRKALIRAKEMIDQGADIIDIGGESTRPGSAPVSLKEELGRVLPVIEIINKTFKDIPISIDTNKSEVAVSALKSGAGIINCLGGFKHDLAIADIAAAAKAQVLIYHIRGTPETMQRGEIKYKNIIKDITDFFKDQITIGLQAGMTQDQFILDPGIGFGKTLEQNIEIIKNLHKFQKLNHPLCVGVSRKSHLGQLLALGLKLSDIPAPNQRLEAGLAVTAAAVLKGANIIRTHDVSATKKFLTVFDMLKYT